MVLAAGRAGLALALAALVAAGLVRRGAAQEDELGVGLRIKTPLPSQCDRGLAKACIQALPEEDDSNLCLVVDTILDRLRCAWEHSCVDAGVNEAYCEQLLSTFEVGCPQRRCSVELIMSREPIDPALYVPKADWKSNTALKGTLVLGGTVAAAAGVGIVMIGANRHKRERRVPSAPASSELVLNNHFTGSLPAGIGGVVPPPAMVFYGNDPRAQLAFAAAPGNTPKASSSSS